MLLTKVDVLSFPPPPTSRTAATPSVRNPIAFTIRPFGLSGTMMPFNAYSRFITSGDVYVGTVLPGVTITVYVRVLAASAFLLPRHRDTPV